MANLLSSLRSTSSALSALQEGLLISQNNVTNANTRGYARQTLALSANDFDPSGGLTGGVSVAGIRSSRDSFAEYGVRRELSLQADAQQDATQLSWIETAVDLNDSAGVSRAMDRLFKTFQSWTIAPNSLSEKENVLAAAGDLAISFNRTAQSLEQLAEETKLQIGETVDEINNLTALVRNYNHDRRNGGATDAGLEARIYNTLEELSELANVKAVWLEDGTVTVLAAGEAPLVVGEQTFELKLDFVHADSTPTYPDALPAAKLTGAAGNDVTGFLNSGKLGALLRLRNQTLPGYLGSTDNEGDLNRLARQFADRVNTIMADGRPAPASGHHMFEYGSTPVTAAATLRVRDAMTPAVLSASDPSSNPAVVNGKASRLADLARPTANADKIDGLSYMSWFGKLSAQAGRHLDEARQEAESRSLTVAQAQSVRDKLSGVSLDEEALKLVELQRAYQANARVVTVLDELTQITINLGR
ncbi:MAG TPA: flagellar hook-associated protein FlgK [Bryobacteraceae bacterium]|nr:flagellar hook-associated protein FlgK [Bryobacteraceae bacterium]